MLSVSEAAQRLGISSPTVKNWGERGILTLIKVGRHFYVDEKSVDNIKENAPDLVGQMNAVEQLREELDRTSQTYMNEIKEYKLEMMMRKESTQRVNLYMEIFASLTDLIYEGRYEEREYKSVVSFLKGHSIKEIAEKQGISVSTVIADIRKCNEILFNLQPYTKMQETCRESNRRAKLAEKKEKILRSMLSICREEGIAFLGELQEDDVEKMMIPVDSLNLSQKTKKALMNGRVKYLGDIVYYGEERLMGINGFGSLSLQEIKGWMAHYHLPMGTRTPVWNAIKKVYDKERPYVYERLFELDSETQEYLETCVEGLPEDRVAEIKELFLGLFAMGERYKENFTKYKQINLALRDEISSLEKSLKNEDYYLSPAYEEVKGLFSRVERMRDWKGKDIDLEESEGAAVKAVGIFDCIFRQEAVQAEGRRLQKDEQTIVELEKKVKKLEQQLNEKAGKAKRGADKEKEKQALLDRQVESAGLEKIKTLQEELEGMRKQKRLLEMKLAKIENGAETEEVKQLRKERDEARKEVEERVRKQTEKQYEGDLTRLWAALRMYEGQVKDFNGRFFLGKLFSQLKLYSDCEKKTLFD